MSAQLSKTDSEVSSLTPSSPARSSPPRRPVYYVQSPSRDSHDGEKTTNSFHSTPVLSPMGSPPHSHSNSSLGPHSRESSSTRYSASLKPHKQHKTDGSGRKGRKPWKEFDAIEEEGLLDGDNGSHGLSRRCYFLAFIVGFWILFFFVFFDSLGRKPASKTHHHHEEHNFRSIYSTSWNGLLWSGNRNGVNELHSEAHISQHRYVFRCPCYLNTSGPLLL